jgi:hypothetical protein
MSVVLTMWKRVLERIWSGRRAREEEISRALDALQKDISELRGEIELVRQQSEASAENVEAATGQVQGLERQVRGLRKTIAAKIPALEAALAVLAEHPQISSMSSPRVELASPVVSVVMPTWNRAGVIGAAVRSVQAQSFGDWELIVLDDGSTDNTNEVMEGFSTDARIRYAPQAHLGQCAARNHALRLARGGLIAYLDSDNLWFPDFLSAMVDLFSHRPKLGCAYGAIVNGKGRPSISFESYDRERLLQNNFIPITAFVHRRSLVDRYGGFDENLERYEDWDLVLRYTEHAVPHALPVRAARRRVMDDIRVTDTRPKDSSRASVLRKWLQPIK